VRRGLAKTPHQRWIRPKDFLMAGFDLFALKAHHKRVTLQFTIPEDLPPLLLDPVPFVRVLHLLVDRALDVTPRGGVTVRARRTAEGVVIMVEDEGPSVAPMNMPKLFLGSSPDADLHLAAHLTRRLDGVLTASSGGRQQGLCINLWVPIVLVQS
jgi:K+-sensing histidine kinase KdpD